MTRIAYIVHNLSDSAVARRIQMFHEAGAEVVVAGFCRDEVAPPVVAGAPALSLGRTHDAALVQRGFQVLRSVIDCQALVHHCRGADVIVARSLEALAPAVRARAQAHIPRLVYECLDIHRTLIGTSMKSRALRAIERGLLRRADLVLYSSPSFRQAYLEPLQKLTLPMLLVENKLLQLDGSPPHGIMSIPTGPPWRIGWFGNLRCRRTLSMLSALAEAHNGQIEILVAGKPSPAEFPDFARAIDRPWVTYHGPYVADQLPELYGKCHFAWAIDYFEEGLNSTWLLPNRLYEAASFGVVPIALAGVATGHWLAQRGAGVLLQGGNEAVKESALLKQLDDRAYRDLHAAMVALPRGDVIADSGDCINLLGAIAG